MKSFLNSKVTWKTILLLIVVVFVQAFVRAVIRPAETSQPQTKMSNDKVASEIETKKNYIAGCTAQNSTVSQCECGFEKVISKYGYDGFNQLIGEMNQSELVDGVRSNSKVAEFIEFLKSEEMKSCSDKK